RGEGRCLVPGGRGGVGAAVATRRRGIRTAVVDIQRATLRHYIRARIDGAGAAVVDCIAQAGQCDRFPVVRVADRDLAGERPAAVVDTGLRDIDRVVECGRAAISDID